MARMRQMIRWLRASFHGSFLLLIVAAYVAAAVAPDGGLWLKRSTVPVAAGIRFPVPMVLLATLLFNAGVGASAGGLRSMARRPGPLLAGLIANVVVPGLFLFGLHLALKFWHDSAEANSLLIGLGVVIAMPIAGSSAAWAHNANGNVALSLGLVLGSTLLSPLSTPGVLGWVGTFVHGDLAGVLSGMSELGTGEFLTGCVVIPSAVGLLARQAAGSGPVDAARPSLKRVNATLIVALCYINASVALPHVAADPDWDFLVLVALAATALCVTTFASGWCLAWLMGADGPDRRALMFGLGMNNNGTGLVLAGSALGTLPWALVPVLAYNLIQHAVAGAAAALTARCEHG